MDAKHFVVGQTWLQRCGEVVAIERISDAPGLVYPIDADDGNSYTTTGEYLQSREGPRDLISLVQDVAAGPPVPELQDQIDAVNAACTSGTLPVDGGIQVNQAFAAIPLDSVPDGIVADFEATARGFDEDAEGHARSANNALRQHYEFTERAGNARIKAAFYRELAKSLAKQ